MLKSFTISRNDEIDSLAIGGFDGMHRGHQVLISKLSKKGAVLNIDRGGEGLTPKNSRCLYHDKQCIVVAFEAIKGLLAEEFIQMLQKQLPQLKRIVVGYDFHFGKGRVGDVALLEKLFSGEVLVVEEVFYAGHSVHSRYIKDLLTEGDILQANALLGREYSVEGVVIKGQGLGQKSLYPTFNLACGDFFLPKPAVYVTRCEIAGRLYPSVSFVGKRLSTDGQFSVETHILDEDFSVTVDTMTLYFVDYLRENRKFDDLGDLKEQIAQDIKSAKLRLA